MSCLGCAARVEAGAAENLGNLLFPHQQAEDLQSLHDITHAVGKLIGGLTGVNEGLRSCLVDSPDPGAEGLRRHQKCLRSLFQGLTLASTQFHNGHARGGPVVAWDRSGPSSRPCPVSSPAVQIRDLGIYSPLSVSAHQALYRERDTQRPVVDLSVAQVRHACSFVRCPKFGQVDVVVDETIHDALAADLALCMPHRSRMGQCRSPYCLARAVEGGTNHRIRTPHSPSPTLAVNRINLHEREKDSRPYAVSPLPA